MTLKTLAAAATLAVFATTGVKAATFDFAFDTSTSTSIDPTLTAVGTLDINVAPGSAFGSGDVSNVSIVIDSDLFAPFLLIDSLFTAGTISSDGGVATFAARYFTRDLGLGLDSAFGCALSFCSDGFVFGKGLPSSPGLEYVQFATAEAALSAFQATAQVSAVPLPAGGLVLLSGIGGVAALKRRKKRAA